MVCFKDRLVVPKEMQVKVLEEAHKASYTIHPGITKMYHDLKRNFWWNGMKKDVAEFVSRCLTCQQVKAEHQKLSGLMQKIEIPQ